MKFFYIHQLVNKQITQLLYVKTVNTGKIYGDSLFDSVPTSGRNSLGQAC